MSSANVDFMGLKILTILFLLCSSILSSAQIRFKQLPAETIQSRLSQANDENSARAQTLKQMFVEAGCADVSEAKVRGDSQPNVVCVLPGKTDRVIVVGAHFDKVKVGHGVVDNWSGVSLLPSLVESIAPNQRQHTIVFVGFTGEEKGLVGSKAYVKALSKENLSKVSAMVNFDTLGLSPTKVWASHGNGGLVNALAQMATMMKLPLSVMNVDGAGSTDSESFRERNIPAITIHSVTRETWPVLHSAKDNLGAVKMDDYYSTYRLSAAYLVMLDQGLDRPVPAESQAAQQSSPSKSQ